MRAVLRYTMHLAVATLGAMLLAVPVVFACAAVTDVFRLGVTGTAYQRLGSTPPFVIQVAIAFVFGFAVAAWNANRDSAKWVWVVPTIWMLIALIAWKPVAGATESVWVYFFSPIWWRLPPSPLRSKWVIVQFSHTVPLYTSFAYSIGAALRRPRRRQEVPHAMQGATT